jgi:putative transposase
MSTLSAPIIHVNASVRGRRHLLVHEGCARVVLESLAWFRSRGWLLLYAFAILPPRLHFLCRPNALAMEELLTRFQTFTSARMVSILRRNRRNFLLQSFHSDLQAESIWDPFQTEELATQQTAWERLEELHHMPVQREWQLALAPEEYPFSSACFYINGMPPIIAVDDLRLVFEGRGKGRDRSFL